MSWSLAAALLLMAGTPVDLPVPTDPSLLAVTKASEVATPWRLEMRVTAPMTTTDPQHVGYGLGIGRTGRYRVAVGYQPAGRDPLGWISSTTGIRLFRSDRWTIAADAEHAQSWSVRQLYQTSAFQYQEHDRRWTTLGVLSAMASQRRWLGAITGFEVGAGRMVIRQSVGGRVGEDQLNPAPVLVLKTAATVGMVGMTASRPLLGGFSGDARLRVVGAGRSRGGTVPFAHAIVDWELSRTVFRTGRHGHGQFSITGTHATSNKATTYFQNGLGVKLKIAF